MNKIISFGLLLISSVFTQNNDSATLQLIQNEDKEWLLQLNSSISILEEAVKQAYEQDAYSSIEDFQELSIKHVHDHITLIINAEDTATLHNPSIKFDHGSSLTFELADIPDEIHDIKIINAAFDDLHGSPCTFEVVAEGIESEQYLLTKDNGFQADITLNKTPFSFSSFSDKQSRNLIAMAVFIGLIAFMDFYKGMRHKKSEKAIS